jgi:Tol biopolymer transport system component
MMVVRDEATGGEKINDVYVTPHHHVAWLPDGDLLIRAATDAGEDMIYRWSLDRGTTIPVATWPRQADERVSLTFAVSRDGSTLFYSTVGNGELRIVRRQLDDGQEQLIAARPAMNNPQLSLSPCGKLLALVAHSSIWLVDLESRALRPLHELQDRRNHCASLGIPWAPCGQHLIFSMARGDPQRPRTSSLWRIAVEGGQPQPLGVTRQHIEHLAMHPEGKQLAFSSGGGANGQEVWAFESSLLVPEE